MTLSSASNSSTGGISRFAAIALFAALLLPAITIAHHSRSEFTDEVTEIEGELVRVNWRNPHAGLDVRLVNEVGEEELWRVETFGSPNLFSRMGVEREYFNVGERVTVAGRASTRRPRYFLGLNVLFESGMEAVLSATIPPRWSDYHVGGVDQSDIDLSNKVDAASENLGIFRNWSIAGRQVETRRHFPYTEGARAAMAAWDPVTAPVARCETPGMPVPMIQPLSMNISDGGETATLQTEYFGVVRTFHLEDAADPQTQPASPLGYSVGYWEGSTLVVETTRINYPWFNSAGAPQSEDVRVLERFELSEDQSELMYRITITDPVTFTGPATYERLYVALGAPFVILDCTVF